MQEPSSVVAAELKLHAVASVQPGTSVVTHALQELKQTIGNTSLITPVVSARLNAPFKSLVPQNSKAGEVSQPSVPFKNLNSIGVLVGNAGKVISQTLSPSASVIKS